VYNNLITI